MRNCMTCHISSVIVYNGQAKESQRCKWKNLVHCMNIGMVCSLSQGHTPFHGEGLGTTIQRLKVRHPFSLSKN